jgi:acetoacetate decarboxylase
VTDTLEREQLGSRAARPPMYRMPYGFGPSPGPRQGPDGRSFDFTTSKRGLALYLSFATDSAVLEPLVPPAFELVEPLVTVRAGIVGNNSFLAGRSYNVLGVYFPVEHVGKQRTKGSYCSVLWESLTDPILTGREELGMAKLYAAIDVQVREDEPTYTVRAGWLGYTFATMHVRALGEAPAPAAPPLPTFNYKYVPRTGEWGVADAEYPVAIAAEDPSVTVEGRWAAEASIEFARPEWEDMPTQAHIVRALADLPQLESRGASVVRTLGGKDLADATILE